MTKIFRAPPAIIALASSCLLSASAADNLCSIPPYSYSLAKTAHPHLKSALDTMEQHSITAWYTDRQSDAESTALLANITSKCSEDSRMTIAVYGIPSKDCSAGLSSAGSVHSTSDYETFLAKLTTAVGTRKVLYIVEPDAVGLLADNGCGKAAGYLDNLKVAVSALSANANAELYVDVGYWLLADSTKASEVATIVKELSDSGTLKGVAINTSNYRSSDECTTYCNNFQTAMGSTTMSCIVDTSRNYNGSPTTDWCNVKSAGIGNPPTSETGISNIDYFMWVKPPGESDGVCTDATQSDTSLTGVTAGSFYEEAFQLLWDQGYFVSQEGMATISGNDANQSYSQGGGKSGTIDTSVKHSSGSEETISAGTVVAPDTSSLEIPTSAPEPTATTPTMAPTPAVAPTPTVAPTNTSADTSVIDSTSKQSSTGCKAKKTRVRLL